MKITGETTIGELEKAYKYEVVRQKMPRNQFPYYHVVPILPMDTGLKFTSEVALR